MTTLFKCEPCDLVCSSEDQYIQHVNGRKHVKTLNQLKLKRAIDDGSYAGIVSAAKKSRSVDPYKCNTCNLKLNSPEQFQQHMRGRAHLDKARDLGIPVDEETDFRPTGQLPPPGNYEVYGRQGNNCMLCNIQFSLTHQADLHFKGIRHLKAARARRAFRAGLDPDNYFCEYCNCTVTSDDQLKIHQEGAKHKNRVEKANRRAEDRDGGGYPGPGGGSGGGYPGAPVVPAFGARFADQMSRGGQSQQQPPQPPPLNEKPGDLRPLFPNMVYCGACNISTPNPGMFHRHCNTERHMWNVQRQQGDIPMPDDFVSAY